MINDRTIDEYVACMRSIVQPPRTLRVTCFEGSLVSFAVRTEFGVERRAV